MLRKYHYGFTYIFLLIMVAVMGATMAITAIVWSKSIQREQEQQLLFVGDEFRKAIGLYYERTPGTSKKYPKSLSDLLLDKRYPSLQRYLRVIYNDPLTGNSDWGLVRNPDGGIIGVYSLNGKHPQNYSEFPIQYLSFRNKNKYSDWIFAYYPNEINRR